MSRPLPSGLAAALARLKSFAVRIDALSLRERVVVFLCVVAILAAVFDSFVLAAQRSEAQTRAKALTQQNQDLGRLREQFTAAAAAARGTGQDARERALLAGAQRQQAQLQQALAAGFANLGRQAGLRELLAPLLKQHPGLSLVKLSALDGGVAPLVPRPAAPPGTELQWRGIEMQIAGRYLDQLNYLMHLERALPQLHWGELRLWSQGDSQPVLMQVQLFIPKERP